VPQPLERLIVFTRYPQVGKAKTRLIPALGEAGAMALHRQMAEHTLAQVQKLQVLRPLEVEVRFTGGDRDQMQNWLGHDLHYVLQGEGDLGERLVRSLQSAFTNGVESVVVIGTDCPDLSAALMAQALDALHNHDLVVGPARDGGYYLIGLRRLVPELFQGIAWSTAAVFQQTIAIAQTLNLQVTTLPTLADVDRPEDLLIWERFTTS
jgi:uncharacterized protein